MESPEICLAEAMRIFGEKGELRRASAMRHLLAFTEVGAYENWEARFLLCDVDGKAASLDGGTLDATSGSRPRCEPMT